MSLPLFFLDVLSDVRNKGQNPSTHHPGIEGGKKICVFQPKGEMEMNRQDKEDRKVEKAWQAPERYRRDIENERENMRQTQRQSEGKDFMP